ncbi:pentapeptide repeat-containing protein [Arthrobacter sp. A5]|uniref:pentapeptide repeat-containing protein n=1 Tax=Arthrobacter sp. A5 TaxID=576926 RepID=UPI003DAA3100
MAAAKSAGSSKLQAPRLSAVRLHDLRDAPQASFQSGVSYDGERYDRPALDGLDITAADFIECEFNGATFHEAQLRGTRFRDCLLADSFAPVFTAARSSWRDVVITALRWGSAELYDSTWQSVRIDGGKLDFVNLRAAKISDLLISDCIINELDLGGSAVNRVALKNCRIGTLDVGQATLKDLDLRSSEFKAIHGIGNLAGSVIDDYQLGLLAPLLADHLGITVA